MKNESKILFLTCFCHFLSHCYMFIFPAMVLPVSEIFDIPVPDVLPIGFYMYMLFGIGSLPMGILSDKLGSVNLLRIFLLGSSAALLAAAMSNSPLALTLSLAALGVCASIYHPAGLGLISKGCKRRGYAMGINGIFGSIGIAVTPFVSGVFIYLWGFKSLFLSLMAMVLSAGIVSLFVRINEDPVETTAPKKKRATNTTIGYFLILCVCMVMVGFIYRGISVIMPAYFEKNAPFLFGALKNLSFMKTAGIGNLTATLLTTIAYSFGIAGQLVGGKIADRYDLRKSYFVFYTLALPFLILMGAFNNIPLIAVASIFIFFELGSQPVENSLIAAFTPSNVRATAYGLKFILVFGIGSFSLKVSQYLMKAHSFSAIFYLQTAVLLLFLVMLGLLIFLSRKESIRN